MMEAIAAQVERDAHVVAALELIRGAGIQRTGLVVVLVGIVGLILADIFVVQITHIDVIVVTIVIVIAATDYRWRAWAIVAYDAILIDRIAVGTVYLVYIVYIYFGQFRMHCVSGGSGVGVTGWGQGRVGRMQTVVFLFLEAGWVGLSINLVFDSFCRMQIS